MRLLRQDAARTRRAQCLSICHPLRRSFTAGRTLSNQRTPKLLDVEYLLSKPTWSISSLLPSKSDHETISKQSITSKQLHHLLRLSALPPPSSPEEEKRMLSTLQSQLHFVRAIQSVDTTGVEPLRSLRDETEQGEKEAQVGLEEMRGALEGEELRGKWHRRIRRRKERNGDDAAKDWDPLAMAERKTGRYFVVEGGKKAKG